MKILLITLLAIFVLSGCATYSVEKMAADGSSIKAEIKSLWHNVQQLDASYESDSGAKLNVTVGSMGADLGGDALTCILYPHLCEK